MSVLDTEEKIMRNVLILHSETISFYVTRRQKSPKDRFELRESIRFIYCYFLKEESAELRDLGIHSLAKSIRIFNKHMLCGTLSTSLHSSDSLVR